jgi:hypothetical protein
VRAKQTASGVELVQPDPEAWPACSVCATDYVLRRAYVLGEGRQWVYQRDCKCRGAVAMIRLKSDEARGGEAGSIESSM